MILAAVHVLCCSVAVLLGLSLIAGVQLGGICIFASYGACVENVQGVLHVPALCGAALHRHSSMLCSH